MNPQWSESQESRVTLQETPQCAPIFPEFIRYFYTGQIKINYGVVLPILCLADKYNVRDLISLCLDYMSSHIPIAAIHGTLVSWLDYTSNNVHEEITQACQNFIMWNFELIAKTDDFGTFDVNVLVSLLHQSSLVVRDEMTLYRCLEVWLKCQIERLESQLTPEELETTQKKLVVAVMSTVREIKIIIFDHF